MEELGGAIAELIIQEHGQEVLLERLADPYWFQAFGCVLGFDWHSSGLTTTTMGALKEALDPQEHGIAVVGGKGATSRKTPNEIEASPLDISPGAKESLVKASKLSAMVDNACVQDTFQLYHHTMIITESGEWGVIQQGMNDSYARRYHWVSSEVSEFVVEPQSAICSQTASDDVLDLSACSSEDVRDVSLDLVQDNPEHLKSLLRPKHQRSLSQFTEGSSHDQSSFNELRMPSGHELTLDHLSEQAIDQLQNAYEYQPDAYEELIAIDGVGPKSVRALALIGELVYDADASRDDPAKYAYAHGGKDGTPHPVDRQRYDQSVEEVRQTLDQAEVDRETKQTAFQRLAELDVR